MKIAGPIEEKRVGGNVAVRPGHARAVSGKADAAGTESIAELDYRREPAVITVESRLAGAGDDKVVNELSLHVRVFRNVYARPVGGIIVRDRVADEQRRYRRRTSRVPFHIDSAALVGAVAGN